MERTLAIRPRTSDDTEALVKLLAETHAKDGYPMRDANVRAGWLYDDAFARAWVAIAGDQVVGHLAVKRGYDNVAVAAAVSRPLGDILSITRLFVGTRARGLGAASALMDAADHYATSIALPLALDVIDGSTAAIALYERRGWLRVATEPATWTAPDGTHPIVHLYIAPFGRGAVVHNSDG